MDKQKLIDFLKQYELCVISTANKQNEVESAVMALVTTEECSLLMSTETGTRKWKNMQENNHVAVVVGGLKNDPSAQINGEFKELTGENALKAKEYMLKVHPEWEHYFDSPTSAFFCVTPTWVRFSDFSQSPPLVTEANI